MAEQPPDDHASRVQASFDALRAKVEPKLDDASREAIERVRAAAASKDVAALRTHVEDLKERHGWLYKELATHPRIASLLDELALLGL
ncbi:MAG TPA: hypothetical protein VN032_08865 [Thermoanaerobaculia bacterium]|jgi:hypothetical protein|nr:hypothetical protein [Thermoanaerobaculia bacterium]